MTAVAKAPVRTYRRRKSTRRRVISATGSAVFHIVSATMAVLFMLPLIWIALISFKGPTENNAVPPTWLPREWTISNYVRLVDFGEGIGVYVWNSVQLVIIVTLGTVILTVLAGYGFARFKFRFKGPMFVAFLIVFMVPYATLLVPLYFIVTKVGLGGTVIGVALILIMFNLPFGIFLMRNSFESVPRELEEAALVDGANAITALRHVSLPLVAPGLVTIALFTAIGTWNEFVTPQIFLNSGNQYPLSIMLLNIKNGSYNDPSSGVVFTDYGAVAGGVVISVIPVLIIYLLLQRYFVAGLTSGGLRG